MTDHAELSPNFQYASDGNVPDRVERLANLAKPSHSGADETENKQYQGIGPCELTSILVTL